MPVMRVTCSCPLHKPCTCGGEAPVRRASNSTLWEVLDFTRRPVLASRHCPACRVGTDGSVCWCCGGAVAKGAP